MRILFAGSPAIAVPSLQALSDMELEGKPVVLAGVLTNPDSKRHRTGPKIGNEEPTDVSAAVSELDVLRKGRGLCPIPQIKPEKLDERIRKEVASLAPDLLVSFACGHFFGPRFLALFPLGGINIHPSLLPRYRGASPIPAAILAREKETGICIQKLAAQMDTGDLLAVEHFALSGRETTLSLSETAGRKAALMLRDVLPDFNRTVAVARSQEGEAIYCRQIKKEDGIIDWNKSASEIDAQIRAYTPWPLSFTCLGQDTLFILEAAPLEDMKTFSETEIVREKDNTVTPGTVLGTDREKGILIQTGDGILAVRRLQWQTKKALDWKDFCNGTRCFAGSRLG